MSVAFGGGVCLPFEEKSGISSRRFLPHLLLLMFRFVLLIISVVCNGSVDKAWCSVGSLMLERAVKTFRKLLVNDHFLLLWKERKSPLYFHIELKWRSRKNACIKNTQNLITAGRSILLNSMVIKRYIPLLFLCLESHENINTGK